MPKKKKTAPSNPCYIHFDNKAIEIINLAKIFKSLNVTELIPSSAKDFITPTIIYTCLLYTSDAADE